MSSRIHGGDHPNFDKYLPRSVRAACLGFVGDIIQHLRQVDHKPDQCALSGKPHQPGQSCLTCVGHYCPRHAERHCNCAGDTCADDDHGDAGDTRAVRTPEPNHLGNFRCPVSGLACSSDVCGEWCEGIGSGAEAGHDRCIAKAAHNNRNHNHEAGDA